MSKDDNANIDLFEIVLDREADDMSTEFVIRARSMIKAARVHQHQDRSALLRMAGNVASGLEANKDCNEWRPEHVAERAVAVARAILAEVDRGE